MPKSTQNTLLTRSADAHINSAHLDFMLAHAGRPDVGISAAANMFGMPKGTQRGYDSLPSGEVEQRDCVPWLPTEPTKASRFFPKRSAVSVRGSKHNPHNNRQLIYHSWLERDFADVFLADRRIEHIQEQAEPQVWHDSTGRVRHHIFDFVVTLKNGRRIAVAVKPEQRRLASGIDETVHWFNTNARGKLADAHVVRTRKHLSRATADNARLVLWARRLHNEADTHNLRALILGLHGTFQLSTVLRAFGPLDRGFVAAINLMDEGLVRPRSAGRIDHDTEMSLVRADEAAK